MRIDKLFGQGEPVFSFEFFPPKTPEGEANLFQAVEELRALDPAYVSVTYGAGGGTRDKTLDIVTRIRRDYGLEAMAHFTCVGATERELRDTLDRFRDAGIENVLALRGDPPQGQDEWVRTEGGLEHSAELVALLAGGYPFAVAGACFPETHIHATSREDDLRHLKAKVDAGVQFLITQLFFDNGVYEDFVARAREIGIDVPIVPGIMPITNVAQIKRITELCGSGLPGHLLAQLEARAEDPGAVSDFGVAYATLQCAELLAMGAPGIHFYTLNRSPATRAILSALQLMRPWARAPRAALRRAAAPATS
ncbi:methylenetetrahydrofolate reductase [NAD(P)H] [Capillimicrobium parvum]|uniref:Methylenetetrahydrofolate reductase n=1 Tax=Capillimicrobium parvum TaxID=2884022 RepID=A0A9E7BXN9_9ACTN|nr:methylenetetrahydrofolate reductase [NAD(P)H] [Capillimicrobium parvum]UGS34111.1 5,10-methylenetetrahydrofolate reductase [Capillimicrobium parvum]